MHESFYRDSPTVRFLKIKQNPVLDELAMKAMAEGMTLVAK